MGVAQVQVRHAVSSVCIYTSRRDSELWEHSWTLAGVGLLGTLGHPLLTSCQSGLRPHSRTAGLRYLRWVRL